MDDEYLTATALAGSRGHEARLKLMIEQHESGRGYIATANDGKYAERNDEDLASLEERLALVRADIEDIENER
jgi:hypothetical protein